MAQVSLAELVRRPLAVVGGAVDLGSALDLVGGVLKWVAITFVLPGLVALA